MQHEIEERTCRSLRPWDQIRLESLFGSSDPIRKPKWIYPIGRAWNGYRPVACTRRTWPMRGPDLFPDPAPELPAPEPAPPPLNAPSCSESPPRRAGTWPGPNSAPNPSTSRRTSPPGSRNREPCWGCRRRRWCLGPS